MEAFRGLAVLMEDDKVGDLGRDTAEGGLRHSLENSVCSIHQGPVGCLL